MKKRAYAKAGILATLWLAAGAGDVRADARRYVWTYEYMTMPEGAAEVEYYLTLKVPDTGTSDIHAWQHQVELEYGLTPRWDASLYQVWEDERKGDESRFDYEGFKVRTRYRLAEQGELPVDVLFYGEYKRNSDWSDPDAGEVKLVLAKQFGAFDASYNQILERSLSDAGDTAHKYAAGVGYEVRPGVHVGAESTGDYRGDRYSLGPTLSLSHRRYFIAIGALAGLNGRTPDVQARLIVGVGL